VDFLLVELIVSSAHTGPWRIHGIDVNSEAHVRLSDTFGRRLPLGEDFQIRSCKLMQLGLDGIFGSQTPKIDMLPTTELLKLM
jgi:hypothetical protein